MSPGIPVMQSLKQSHQDTGSVKLEVHNGFATITLRHPEHVISGDALTSLSVAVRECARRTHDIFAVFFWSASQAQPDCPNRAGSSSPERQAAAALHLKPVYEMLDRLPQVVVGFAAGPLHNSATCLLLACDVVFATSDVKFMLTESGGAVAALVSRRLGITAGPWIDGMTACKLGLVSEVLQDAVALNNRYADFHQASVYCTPVPGASVKQLMRSSRRSLSDPAIKAGLNDTALNNVPVQRTIPAVSHAATPGTDSLQPAKQRSRAAWAPHGAEMPLPKFSAPTPAGQAKGFAKLHEPMFIVLDATLTSDVFGSEAAGGAKHTAPEEEGLPKHLLSSRPPKRKDFVSMFQSYRGPITSIMICNIACRITQVQLADAVDSLGFKGKYDYLYLPTGGRSSKVGTSNLGYGFISFPDPRDTADFNRVFTGYRFECTSSLKEVSLRPAHAQGSFACEKDQKIQGPDKEALSQASPKKTRRSNGMKAQKPPATTEVDWLQRGQMQMFVEVQ